MTVTQGRRTRRFSWNSVDERLVRKLLEQIYINNDDAKEARKVARLSPDELGRNAARILGQGVGKVGFTRRG